MSPCFLRMIRIRVLMTRSNWESGTSFSTVSPSMGTRIAGEKLAMILGGWLSTCTPPGDRLPPQPVMPPDDPERCSGAMFSAPDAVRSDRRLRHRPGWGSGAGKAEVIEDHSPGFPVYLGARRASDHAKYFVLGAACPERDHHSEIEPVALPFFRLQLVNRYLVIAKCELTRPWVSGKLCVPGRSSRGLARGLGSRQGLQPVRRRR